MARYIKSLEPSWTVCEIPSLAGLRAGNEALVFPSGKAHDLIILFYNSEIRHRRFTAYSQRPGDRERRTKAGSRSRGMLLTEAS